MWEEYLSLIKTKAKPTLIHLYEDKTSTDYLNFSAFLILFISYDETELIDFIYWLFFVSSKKQVSTESLSNVLKLISKSKIESKNIELKRQLNLLEKATKVIIYKHN